MTPLSFNRESFQLFAFICCSIDWTGLLGYMYRIYCTGWATWYMKALSGVQAILGVQAVRRPLACVGYVLVPRTDRPSISYVHRTTYVVYCNYFRFLSVAEHSMPHTNVEVY